MNAFGFLEDAPHINIKSVTSLIADLLIGNTQHPKLVLRYNDMRSNFEKLTYDEWDMMDTHAEVWRFSSGVTPYRDYDDTTNVPIPISNPEIKVTADNAVTSLDLPTWFLASDAKHNVMLVTQDPMPRSLEWYGECRDAICSSPFGLHAKTWREKGNGGGRMWALVKSLVSQGCNVYLTDVHKFYFQSLNATRITPTEDIVNLYRKMFLSECEIFAPDIIVAFGNEAQSFLAELPISFNVLRLPHFSGQAQGKIKEFFNIPSDHRFTIEEQADCYSSAILKSL